ncbi:MAG: M23 family metallopeptidase [Tannerellaceae bacterium]|nr:M23 family metallopeptidase [Tannerellaceae bacterium]
MRLKIVFILSLFVWIHSFPGVAQSLRNPFDFPILLSGNFGELRSNHFHAGIDFKTQGVEGKPVHAVEEGYISRIGVSPWGYGNVLYIDHPDGTTTVYGHLQKFAASVAQYVKEQQYEKETFTVNLYPGPELFPVKKGEVIALAGNSGSSAGPHLHFEVRDTQTEEVLDPLLYYKEQIKDTRPPAIQGVMIYPIEGKGIVNNQLRKVELKPVKDKNGKLMLSGKVEAWGGIGLGIKAYDYMDNTTNIYGVKEITLQADGETIFYSHIDRYALKDTRYLNSFTDYEEWRDRRSFYMKSFVDPGNRLPFIESINRGILRIEEERPYHLTYLLKDAHGNSAEISLTIQGKEQSIRQPELENDHFFHWRSDNRFGAKGIRLMIPKGNLYNDFFFRYQVKEDSTALAATHILHNRPVAFHTSGKISIKLQTDTLENKQQYGIVRLQHGKPSWIGGEYRYGWIDADIRELGTYTIRQDTKPPVITPVNQEKWISSCTFTFRISDNLSGVKSYRGEIDGHYVLFEFDGKKGLISYTFDPERLEKGSHELSLTVTDACGNETRFIHPFRW